MLLKKIIEEVPSLSKARLMYPELMKYLEEDKYITLQKLKLMVPENESFYTMQIENEPHQLAFYLRDLATEFHSYYNSCQFIVDSCELRNARLNLISASKQVIYNGLGILGVFAPEKM